MSEGPFLKSYVFILFFYVFYIFKSTVSNQEITFVTVSYIQTFLSSSRKEKSSALFTDAASLLDPIFGDLDETTPPPPSSHPSIGPSSHFRHFLMPEGKVGHKI